MASRTRAIRDAKPWLVRVLGPGGYGRLKQLLDRFLFRYRQRSYSQSGEDLVLARLFEGQATGVYVDVGAFHPRQLSNTQLLHERGWRGLNVDPTPGSMRLFRALRPRDVNLELAISDEPGVVKLHSWGLHAENSMAPDQVRAVRYFQGPPHEVVEAEARTLTEVLDASELRDHPIDLLNVDTEGHDLAVLRSLDWKRYRPRVVVIEVFQPTLERVVDSPRYRFMIEQGYRAIGWYAPSVILERLDEPA